jgi:hypothetical protein
MPVSFEILRVVLGVIGIGCAYMLGRAVVAVRKGWQRRSRLYGWAVRTAACLLAMTVRHPVDLTAILIWSLSAVAFAAAYWNTSRERREEDLTETMFPVGR